MKFTFEPSRFYSDESGTGWTFPQMTGELERGERCAEHPYRRLIVPMYEETEAAQSAAKKVLLRLVSSDA